MSDKDKPSRSAPGAVPTGFIQPQLGFNNNVRYRGVVFHIQTEDSGMHRPHVTTHLFADGGRVIKTQRTDYSDLVKLTDFTPQLRQLMKEQHRAMFVALRSGALDALLGGLPLGPRPSVSPAGETDAEKYFSISPSLAPAAESRARVVSVPTQVPPVPRKVGKQREAVVPEGAAQVSSAELSLAELSPAPVSSKAQEKESERESAEANPANEELAAGAAGPPMNPVASLSPPSSEGGQLPSSRGRAPRPSAVFDFAPDSGRLFGSATARDASIDEAILNYLAGDSRFGS